MRQSVVSRSYLLEFHETVFVLDGRWQSRVLIEPGTEKPFYRRESDGETVYLKHGETYSMSLTGPSGEYCNTRVNMGSPGFLPAPEILE